MVRRNAGVLLLGCLLCSAVQGLAQETDTKPVEIAGIYRCEGDGYTGTVTITQVGETYHLRWEIGAGMHVGIGLRTGEVLASSWSTGRAPAGIVVYTIEKGPRLVGQYASYPGDGRTAREVLTFRGDLPKLPAPRAWNVGDEALVNWSRDAYWYPATVRQRDAERYFVRFDDGDEEWTDATRMIVDDIAVGDRVFGNWQGGGRYYPGTVTMRDGKPMHIRYDDGDEEETTVSFVRVLRPKAPADER